MYGPFGAHDGLLVVQPEHAGLVRFAHQVTDFVALGYLEIVVGLHAAVVGVGRHGVPYRTGLKLRQAHLQLAGAFLQYVAHYQLIDDAVVALLHLAGEDAVGLQRALASVDGDELHGVFLVRVGRVDVELGRVLIVLALEHHVLVAAAHIEGVLEVELVLLAVYLHDAVAAGVDYAEFAVLKEIFRLQRVDGLESQRLGGRHGAAEDQTVVHGVGEKDLIGFHDLGHGEAFAQLGRVVGLHVRGMTGALNGVVGGLGRHAQGAHESRPY